jgi:Zn-dependent peptidase ImmA (M78 family)/DNA-binding XRE family transcriptional regulator
MGTHQSGRESGLPKVIPERIREAREGRGLTAESFADALGVSRQAVAQYEIGQNGPSAEVLSSIISTTRQPATFFVRPRRRKADSPSTPFWRSLKRMEHADRVRITRRLDWACDIVDYVESFLRLPPVGIPDIQWNLEAGSIEDIEDIALRLRADWSLGFGPIHDMVQLLEFHGIILLREKVQCEDMDAVSRWQTGRPYILFSSEVSSQVRVNFNLAHELGHIMLHSGIDVTSDNLATIERQANRFAGAFLLPKTSFPDEVLSTSIEYFKALKQRWRVAIAAMIYRCKDLQILREPQVKYLWRQMNSLGIRQTEPLDDAFEQVSPSLLRAALEMLVAHRVQTKEEIEHSINLNPEDIESLCGTEFGWLGAQKIVAFPPRINLRNNENIA